MAYTSNETGENVVWVRTFPDPTGGRWRVSDGGGIEPLWSPDGRELYYRNSEALVAVQVRTSPVFQKGAATRLTPDGSGSAQAPYLADGLHASYAVARPGEGFVFIRMPEVPSEELIVVENFFEELKERAGG